MDMVTLSATARDTKLAAKKLRRTGQVPAVVYGYKAQLTIQCPEKELHQAFVSAGESALVELNVEGKKIPVLFKDVAFDPVTDREIHADFYAVNMDKEIETLVPVHFDGEPPAVKTLGGVFVISHDHVKVRCLPVRLPHSITVSIAAMENFRDSVSVKDLKVPQGVTIVDDAATVLALVQEPRAIEEVVVAAAATPAEGEAAAGATAEGAPGAEGAAAGAPAAEAQSKEKASKEKGGEKKK